MNKSTHSVDESTLINEDTDEPEEPSRSSADSGNGDRGSGDDDEGSPTPRDEKKNPDAVLKELNSSREGLTEEEAGHRLEADGYNELHEEKQNPILVFLRYFWGPIPWMIEIATVLSAVVGHWADFVIILVLLFMNGIVGFWEEFQAGNAIDALKAKLALHARVRRGGKWSSIPSRELVRGDVIKLRLGDIIPADAVVIDGDEIEVDQSALTGESLPVTHELGETVYSGSIIRSGEAQAVVSAIGAHTFFGKTASLVEETHTQSHFQKAVLKIGDYLIVIAIALVVLIFAVALFRGESILDTLQFALILTIAAVPVALPAVMSVTMAVGARLLSHKDALVSRLSSIEELAGTDVLCSDKTGTLTKNELTLGDPACLGDATVEEAVLAGALASREENQDAIDTAVIGAVKDEKKLSTYKVLHFTPFDPVHKRTEAEVEDADGNRFRVSKGAPQMILELVAEADDIREEVEGIVDDFASRGYRSLGVARTDGNDKFHYLAVLPLYDPPRDDSRDTVATAASMGIDVKMVTGDQVAIAKEIAGQLGMKKNIMDARVLEETKSHESGEMEKRIEAIDGFAQVFPEHKYHIIESLQKRGHLVAMTGDGVNDAPALKRADAGIAVSGATDAARTAADIVLVTPGLSVIIDAIRESRKIFQRMNSYAIYRIAETLRVLLFMTLSILVFNFYPVTAIMIVFLALLNDGPILAIAYDNVRGGEKPERWNLPLVLSISSVLGTAGVIASFGLFFIAERVMHLDPSVIQTFMFLKLAVAGHLTIFVTRTRGAFWSSKPSPVLFWSAVITKILATLAAVYGFFMTPIGWQLSLLIWGYALAWFFVNDRIKIIAYRIFEHSGSWLFARHPSTH
ncbi:plasma-membrane proton-efflux P-type ATPase [bacterium]|nr:plasma-membrane proton-efflux P-type ATPase [bacterium]